MKYDKGKPLTGYNILGHVHSIGKYSFCIGLLKNNSDELIMEERAIYEPSYKEIIADLIQILTITDLRIGEEIFSGDHLLTVKEKEWYVLKNGNLSQPHLRLILKNV
tara:strand:+ start:144 stop:464 length:321 start_codon:yes stop_codon:yes gene_type:complete